MGSRLCFMILGEFLPFARLARHMAVLRFVRFAIWHKRSPARLCRVVVPLSPFAGCRSRFHQESDQESNACVSRYRHQSSSGVCSEVELKYSFISGILQI